jgi:hypothetical protein
VKAMSKRSKNGKSSQFYLMKASIVSFLMLINPFFASNALAATDIVDSANTANVPSTSPPNNMYTPNNIFVKSTGSTNSLTGTLTIPTSCPSTGFRPYVAVSLGGLTAQTASTHSNKTPVKFKLCVTSTTTAAPNVNVGYTYEANFVTFVQYRWYHYDSGIYTYHVSYSTTADGVDDDYYVGNTDSLAFSLAIDEKLPRISYVGSYTTSIPSSLYELRWVLYCYPTSITPPTDSCT